MKTLTDKEKTFLRECSCYQEYTKQYQEILEKISDRWYELSGVKAVDPSKIVITGFNKEYIEQVKLDQLEQLEELLNEKDRIKKQIHHINDVLNRIKQEVRNYIIQIYIFKKTYKEVSDKSYVSIGSIQNSIIKEVRAAL